jgi:hypothetical protein
MRHDTTRLLIGSIGEPRMRELRAHGAVMDRDKSCAFARAANAVYVTASPTS